MKHELGSFLYRTFVKPVLFAVEPEIVHEHFTAFAKLLSSTKVTQKLVDLAFNYQDPNLEKEVLGVKFKNPVGLSAGYDYDGHFVKLVPHVGFGFSTVGTVTTQPYGGNEGPMFARLPKSRSLLVNKGFKNEGADVISKRLMDPELENITFGVSIGNSNVPEVNTVTKAIEDYLECFQKMTRVPYIKYFEINISCPNIGMEGIFYDSDNFSELLSQLKLMRLNQPLFIKMPNELTFDESDAIVSAGLKLGVRGYIFANLVKNRSNPAFHAEEIAKMANLKGNFSGKPTQEGSNRQIKYFREKYGKDIVLVGTGGIFTPQDAIKKFELGADLVQLITGMIFEGPQLIGQITRELSKKATDM